MQLIKRSFVIFSLVMLSLLIAPFYIYADDSVTITKDNIVGCSLLSGSNGGSSIICVMDEAYEGRMTLNLNVRVSDNSSNVTTQVPFVVNGVYAFGTSQYSNINYISSISSISYQNLQKKTGTWSFPMESLNFVIECAGKGYDITDFYKLGQYEYPMYTVPSGSELLNRALTDSNGNNPYFVCVMWVNKNISSPNSFSQYFAIGNGVVDSVESVMNFRYEGTNTRIIKVRISRGDGTSNTTLTTSQSLLIMPIYNRRSSEMGYETQDFCDLFGLPYNGLSNEQEQSAADLQNEQSEFGQSASDLFQYEDDFNDAMNDSLDEINVNFNVGNQLGSKFLASADWVRSQFNTLTNNTPFGIVLSFSLILGIALLLIGKAVR